MKINKLIDHTYLKAFGTVKEIETLVAEAIKYDFKSVCVNPCHVKYCKEQLLNTDVLVCTVIGFPLGANTTETKVFETLDAIRNGADEIDMVMNIGAFKEGNDEYVKQEIEDVVKASLGRTVKVIIETCYLTEEEVIRASELVGKTEAAFVKTSTGFGPTGATMENVKLMKDNCNGKEVKAAGGVRTKEDLEKMLEAGATRIGTSNGVALVKGETGSGY
ncbi:MAG TPA: deoxyribose-phosphate aldolase [Bacillota bacterium]|nr:deoxyribose-phosphate aldolase [Bacillota bacterium]HPF42178.1 deoxyribose-phosphate aldolase [Bacillota bacterium]HPJ85683.1 deoxyribose-phosphate aldolase [Bacillota bacterium]HPQ61680.1 deoxyribose-phosphate aldolase [Bacillota bacterium]HRX91835.1 deoxyribose-phosphate aldolase [Candidatus Izemoplasmatales bacterium]